MNWLKDNLKKKALRRVLVLVIAALLSAIGFSDEIAKEFAEEGADIVVEQVE